MKPKRLSWPQSLEGLAWLLPSARHDLRDRKVARGGRECFGMMTVVMLATAIVIGHSISSRTELPHLLHGCFQRTKKVVLLAVKMMSNDVDASWRG